MELTPREIDKLMVFTVAEVARRRRARGVVLNRPEAIALITDAVVEAARDGVSVARAAEIGTLVLAEGDVMPGVRAMVPLIQVEATFPDGTKLVSVHDPIGGPADPGVFEVSGGHARRPSGHGRIVLLAGPEVTDADRWRAALPELLPGRDAVLATTAAEAADAVSGDAVAGDADRPARPHVVVPLTTGRHPTTIADAARALRWVRDEVGARVCLAAAPGDATRTVSALRANIGRHVPGGAWALVASTPLDPFADAELFRLARLAATHKSTPVEVAFDDRDGVVPTISEGKDRCRKLGAGDAGGDVRVLRADLTLEPPDGEVALWSPPVLSTLLTLVADAALDALEAGHDGIDAALDTDHGHGYAHSHGDDDHAHPHGHGHGHYSHHDHHHGKGHRHG